MKAGLEAKRPGDADALALAAGELVGIAVGVVALQADFDQQVADAVGNLVAGVQSVYGHGLPHDAAHGHAGVQAAHRVLKDDLHLAAELPHACP